MKKIGLIVLLLAIIAWIVSYLRNQEPTELDGE